MGFASSAAVAAAFWIISVLSFAPESTDSAFLARKGIGATDPRAIAAAAQLLFLQVRAVATFTTAISIAVWCRLSFKKEVPVFSENKGMRISSNTSSLFKAV